MRRIYLYIISIVLFLSLGFYWTIEKNLKPQLNEVFIQLPSNNLNIPLNIAVIGDTHTEEDEKSYQKFKTVLNKVELIKPDLLLLVGDYTSNPSSVSNFKEHRMKLINIISSYKASPYALVLGNYESWSNPEEWIKQFNLKNVPILENQTKILDINKTKVCIRGLGDYYTNRFKYIDFPKECNNYAKITITHDPAGAFTPKSEGLFISGHTHCGQVSLPFIGPLWVPTEAPREAYCGLFKKGNKTIFTTSGIGASIYPIRIGTQSQWDLLKIIF